MRCKHKHGENFDQVTPWAEIREQYVRAIRYLQEHQLPVPENLKAHPANRQQMQQYIDAAADESIQHTMVTTMVQLKSWLEKTFPEFSAFFSTF